MPPQPRFELLRRDPSPGVKRRRMKLTAHLHISEAMQEHTFPSTSRHMPSWYVLGQFYLLPSSLAGYVIT
jgi:hypothetical protein